MQIHPVGQDEIADVIDLWEACGLNHPNNNPLEMVERKRAYQPELFLVGKLDGRIVATVMAGYEGRRGWINLLGVHPDSRGKGLGREMMAAAETALAAMGCPKINLQVRSKNASVAAFYENMGYTLEEVSSMGKKL